MYDEVSVLTSIIHFGKSVQKFSETLLIVYLARSEFP